MGQLNFLASQNMHNLWKIKEKSTFGRIWHADAWTEKNNSNITEGQ